MKPICSALSRLLLVAVACVFVFVAQVAPAYSATNGSSPQKGEDQLLQIEKESQKVIQSGEPKPKEKEAKEKTSGGGLNAVQGTADAEKQNRPETSPKETVEKDLGETLKGLVK